MIPILYEPYETEFTSNGLGRLRDCTSCLVTEERNGLYECDFDYPIDGVNYDRIQLGRIIAVQHDDTGDIQPFDIVSYSRPIDGVVSFHAVHISYRQSGLTVSGTGINTIDDAFKALSTAVPQNPFSYNTDIGGDRYVAAFDGVPRSVRSILGGVEGSILDTFGGEYEWDKWTVNLWESRGKDTNFKIRYGVNMVDYQEELDYAECYTAVVPFWAGTDTNGSMVVVRGDMIDSGERMFDTRSACVPLDVSDKFQSKPSKADVNSAGKNFMSMNKTYLPAQSISVDFLRLTDSPEYSDFAQIQNCNLCDRIEVVFPRYGMSGKFQIVKITYDVIQERVTEMELGTLSTSLAQALGVSASLGNGEGLDQGAIVKEIGSSGSWKWRKWSDGRVEAWCTYSFASATPVAWASPVRYMDKTVSIPSGIFDSTPSIIATSVSNQYWVVGVTVTSATTATLRLATLASSAMATGVSLYAYTN